VNIYDKLCLIAQDILAAPASQAYLERGFSVCGLLTAGRTNIMGATENARPDIARLDNAAPYRKGGHHETVSVFEEMLTTSLCLIQGVLYELLIGFMFVSSSFCFIYCYVRQTKLASSLDNVWVHYKIVNDCVIV